MPGVRPIQVDGTSRRSRYFSTRSGGRSYVLPGAFLSMMVAPMVTRREARSLSHLVLGSVVLSALDCAVPRNYLSRAIGCRHNRSFREVCFHLRENPFAKRDMPLGETRYIFWSERVMRRRKAAWGNALEQKSMRVGQKLLSRSPRKPKVAAPSRLTSMNTSTNSSRAIHSPACLNISAQAEVGSRTSFGTRTLIRV